jgi:DNA polymerase III subunit delta'
VEKPPSYLRAVQFSQVIGHAGLKARLIGNIRDQRVAHAQLFLGPRGGGNLAVALAYAQFLLCEQKGPTDSCGSCPACVQMARLEHPDLHLAFPIFLSEKLKTCDHAVKDWRTTVIRQPYLDIDVWREVLDGENKQMRMGVDVAHDIQRRLNLHAFRGGYKVVLIWQPELMDAAAANKMLKVLEEPEPRTVFLLVANNADQLLSTIVSRSQLTKVPALAPSDVATALQARFPELGQVEAEMIGVRSDGDLLEAIDMAEQGEEQLFLFLRDWLRACYARKVVVTADHAEGFQKMGRERQKSLIRYGLQMIRMCVLQWQQVPALVRTVGQEQEFVEGFSRLLTDANALGISRELEQAHVHIERNANPKIVFMDMSYRLMGLLKPRT